MLFDPKWEVKTEAEILSLRGLVAWLETMPADMEYNYDDCSGRCLYGLYMASHNVAWLVSGAVSSIDSGKPRSNFCDLVYAKVAAAKPWTFGDALERARKSVDGDAS